MLSEHPEVIRRLAKEQHTLLLKEVAEERLAAQVSRGRPSQIRLFARAIGRTLVDIGERLVRFGQAELGAGLRGANVSQSIVRE